MKGITELLPILCLMGISCAAVAGDLASVSSGNIRFGIDTALFDYTGTETLGMEVYQQIGLDQLSMTEDSMVGFTTTVVLVSSDGDTTAVDQWSSETEWVAGRSVVNSTVLPVLPGEYTLSVTVTDTGNGRESVLNRTVMVNPIGTFSEIELARVLVPSSQESTNPLRKGNVLVFPAATGSYTLPGEHMAYYYLEIYDLGGSSVQVQGRLETSSGETIFARPWISLDIPEGADAIGFVDSLDLRVARNSGLHRLVFGMIDGVDTLEVEKFLVIGRSMEADSTVESIDEVAENPYPEQYRLILSTAELDIYDSLDPDARNRFYSAYWQNSPEDRQFFEQRCQDAEMYSSPFDEGWETDRGRVYIKYGPPDDVEASLFQGEQVPYEIWYYYGSGNESFVFADMSSTGEYEQIYSSVEGEVSYRNWEEMLSPLAGPGGAGSAGEQPVLRPE